MEVNMDSVFDCKTQVFSIPVPFDDNQSVFFLFCGRLHVKKAVRMVGICELFRCLIFFTVGHIPLFTIWCDDADRLGIPYITDYGNPYSTGCKAARTTVVLSLAVNGALIFVSIVFFLLLLAGLKSDDPTLIKPYIMAHVLWLLYFLISSVLYAVFADGHKEMYYMGVLNLVCACFEMLLFFVTLKCYYFLTCKQKVLISAHKHHNIEYCILSSKIAEDFECCL